MIDDFVRLIPQELLNQSGLVFYSGRAAFSQPAQIYLMGLNPGGDRGLKSVEIIGPHTRSVINDMPERWSAYVDGVWSHRGRGAEPMQQRISHVLRRLKIDPRLTPSSNLIFTRSKNAAALEDVARLANSCWPFHQAVIDRLRPKIIVCMGNECGRYVKRRLGADRFLDQFIEANNRQWKSEAHGTLDGRVVVGVTHPSRVDWRSPQSDPTPLVQRMLDL